MSSFTCILLFLFAVGIPFTLGQTPPTVLIVNGVAQEVVVRAFASPASFTFQVPNFPVGGVFVSAGSNDACSISYADNLSYASSSVSFPSNFSLFREYPAVQYQNRTVLFNVTSSYGSCRLMIAVKSNLLFDPSQLEGNGRNLTIVPGLSVYIGYSFPSDGKLPAFALNISSPYYINDLSYLDEFVVSLAVGNPANVSSTWLNTPIIDSTSQSYLVAFDQGDLQLASPPIGFWSKGPVMAALRLSIPTGWQPITELRFTTRVLQPEPLDFKQAYNITGWPVVFSVPPSSGSSYSLQMYNPTSHSCLVAWSGNSRVIAGFYTLPGYGNYSSSTLDPTQSTWIWDVNTQQGCPIEIIFVPDA